MFIEKKTETNTIKKIGEEKMSKIYCVFSNANWSFSSDESNKIEKVNSFHLMENK